MLFYFLKGDILTVHFCLYFANHLMAAFFVQFLRKEQFSPTAQCPPATVVLAIILMKRQWGPLMWWHPPLAPTPPTKTIVCNYICQKPVRPSNVENFQPKWHKSSSSIVWSTKVSENSKSWNMACSNAVLFQFYAELRPTSVKRGYFVGQK